MITNIAHVGLTVSIAELCFYVNDIDTLYTNLKEKGVDFISEPQYFDLTSQGFGKSKAVYFKDPDGFILNKKSVAPTIYTFISSINIYIQFYFPNIFLISFSSNILYWPSSKASSKTNPPIETLFKYTT